MVRNMTQITTKKILNIQIIIMTTLSVLLGAYLGYRDTLSIWQQNNEHNTAYLLAIFNNYRSEILNGEFKDLDAELQAVTKNLNTSEIKIKNIPEGSTSTIRSPFAKDSDLLQQSQICTQNKTRPAFLNILNGCHEQGFTVYFDEGQQHPYLEISWNVISDAVPVLLKRVLSMIALFLIAAMALSYCVNKLIANRLTMPLLELSGQVEKISKKNIVDPKLDLPRVPEQNVVSEVSILAKAIRRYLEQIFNMQDELRKTSILKAENKIASQVAHDIRSPLAALSVVASELSELPEETRILIRSAVQRIDDIANDLALRKGREKDGADLDHNKENSLQVCLLSGLIESLVSEKRMQHRSKLHVKIESNLGSKAYGLFAKVQPAEFKRVLSNLINNAVEAMDQNGKVVLSLSAPHDDMVQITVSDNGKGIPKEILPKIMKKGATFGKEQEKQSGSGLGLYHASECLKSWGGDIKIESKFLGDDESARTEHGTIVTIFLKKEPVPSWFVPELTVGIDTLLVIVDDDNSIHQIWNNRLEAIRPGFTNIMHFTSPEAIISWHQDVDARAHAGDIIFLCDYELLGYKKNGLEIIEELNIASQAILVTSRFEEPHVKKECLRLGVRLLPKSLAGFVPIVFRPRETKATPLNTIEYVLIDDDPLVRSTWENVAILRKKKLLTFENPLGFFIQMSQINKDTAIYVDVNLSDNMRGEEVTKKLSEKGFTKLYLATGSDKSDFPTMPWIKDIVGKVPPFL